MNARLVFGYGIEEQVFEKKYNLLGEEQRRLERVANRISVILKLKYEVGINYAQGNFYAFDHYLFREEEFPAIIIYLLVTCLDTLAGPAYLEFDLWLNKQSDEKFKEKYCNKEEIIRLYKKYKEEFGISKNLRELFLNLPKATKNWLVKNIRIWKSGTPMPIEEQEITLLMRQLYKYFYEIRRNSFTHSSKTRQVFLAKGSRYTYTGKKIKIPPGGERFMIDDEEWNLAYKIGLDESIILRVIILSAVLQKLKIKVTQNLLRMNLRKYSRLDALYSFINEIIFNNEILDLLSKCDEPEKKEFKSNLLYDRIPMLSNNAAKRMIDLLNKKSPGEASYRNVTCEYIKGILCMNNRIITFNRNNYPAKPAEINTAPHWEMIKNFISELLSTSSAKFVKDWQESTQVRNLFLVI